VSLISWLPTYNLNISPIDAQHKSLFDLLNKLHNEIAKKKSHAAIGDALEKLIQYTKTHFEFEERFLESMQYPEIDKHKAKHAALTQKAIKLQQEFATGNTAIAIEVMNFMLAWLTNHILHTDKRYGAFLQGEGLPRDLD